MFSITLEINMLCNLDCKYCYLGSKTGSRMDKKTAIKAIDFAFDKMRIHRDRMLWFDFVGGEALIDIFFIKELISYIEDKNKLFNYHLKYSITTNATIITQEVIDYLIEKKVNIKISLDGNKEVNDRNRISYEGFSVHDRVIEKLELLRFYEKNTNMFVQVTNVITKNNYKSYYESFVYLVENLHFKVIDTAIDLYHKWNDDEIEHIQQQIKQCFEYFENAVKTKNYFGWSTLDSILHSVEKNQKFYSCGAGIISLYVRTDGRYYACAGNLSESVCLGNAEIGLDIAKQKFLKELSSIDNEECNRCSIYDCCNAKGCMMCNMDINGDLSRPVHIMCQMQKFMSQLYHENEMFISKYIKGVSHV